MTATGSLALPLDHLDEAVEVGDEPISALLHGFPHLHAAVPDEDVGAARRAGLQVRGAVAHHGHHGVRVRRLDVLHRLRLAARRGRELLGVEPRATATLITLATS